MVGVADERDDVAGVGVATRLGMHLRDERADCVDHAQALFLAVLAHGRGDAVGGEDADLARRDIVLVLHEDRAHPLEAADDVVVVHDLVADVDRRPVRRQQLLDDLDRPVDTSAERPRGGEQHPPAVAVRAHAETLSSFFSAPRTSARARLVRRG